MEKEKRLKIYNNLKKYRGAFSDVESKTGHSRTYINKVLKSDSFIATDIAMDIIDVCLKVIEERLKPIRKRVEAASAKMMELELV